MFKKFAKTILLKKLFYTNSNGMISIGFSNKKIREVKDFIQISTTPFYNFSKKAATKLKTTEKDYEDTEKDLEDIFELLENSEEENLFVDLKKEEDEDFDRIENNHQSENGNFILEKDPAKAALNLQTFIMKANEKLSSRNLRNFLNLTENFKNYANHHEINLYSFNSKTKKYLRVANNLFEKG